MITSSPRRSLSVDLTLARLASPSKRRLGLAVALAALGVTAAVGCAPDEEPDAPSASLEATEDSGRSVLDAKVVLGSDGGVLEMGGDGGTGLDSSKRIALGSTHVCAITPSGTVKCWGTGPCVDGLAAIGSNVPGAARDVPGLANIVKLSAEATHMCAVASDGALYCWGDNSGGRASGSAGAPARLSVPVRVTSLPPVKDVAVSGMSTCALLATGKVQCWGNNFEGELGSGQTKSSPIPVDAIATGVVSIDSGYFHTCALLDTGSVKCWGGNSYGQIGAEPASTKTSNVPLEVAGLTNVKEISLGGATTCALLNDGTVRCFGHNAQGELGTTTVASSAKPVVVAGVAGAVDVAAGSDHVCALLATGEALCWGALMEKGSSVPYGGSLGSGATKPSATPVMVKGLTHLTALSLNAGTSCGLLDTGDAYCWGSNYDGELGQGTYADAGSLMAYAPLKVAKFP